MSRLPKNIHVWTKHLSDIEKHLEKNEKYFRRPEKKMKEVEKEMETWNREFKEGISRVEDLAKKLEKKIEDNA